MKKITVIVIIMIIGGFGFSLFFNQNQPILFEKDHLWGYRSRSGKVIIAPQYLLTEKFSRYGIAPVCNPEEGWIYIDQNGKMLIKPYPIKNDNDFDRFSEGLARFEQNGKIGFFNQKGVVVIEPKYEYATRFENNFAAVGIKVTKEYLDELEFIRAEQWGFINQKGVLVIPYRYQEVVALFDGKGRAAVIKDGKKVLINNRGEVME